MVNYQDSFIYKICCKDLTIQDIYIGSTTNFKQRKRQHKECCNNEKSSHHNIKIYNFIRENGGWENWDMILIKNVSCNSKIELNKIEREYYEEYNPSLNVIFPSRSKKEYQKTQFSKEILKSYYQLNKEKLKKRRMERYYNNKV